jgi:predicted adenylyl cyclase CyaB
MPSNVEIKAPLKNGAAAETVAIRLSDTSPEMIRQEDIFFHSNGARLKLRILGADRGELIRYERSDVADARCSRYLIARTADPQVFKEILTKTLGITGVVKKTRTLYLIGQTRVHIDEVEGLGTFLELEVVLREGQSQAEGKDVAKNLMAEFGIDKQELIPEAYVDLLNSKGVHRAQPTRELE